MSAPLVTALCLVTYVLGYHFYGRRIAERVFRLDPNAVTPAHALQDGVDYVPSRKYVLFGHHYASIAGLSPMLGPAIAVIWGWVPAMLWVVFGTLLIGAVHDFSALVVSMRAQGKSIGMVAETVIGPRAKSLFHAIIFFLIALAMGVFVQVVSQLFSAAFYPESVFPTAALMVLAVALGVLFYKKGLPLAPLTAAGFVLTLGSLVLGLALPKPDLSQDSWSLILLLYGFAASVLPVWLLLQPRDYLNSLLLYLGLLAIFGGFMLLRPEFVAPAFDPNPAGAPPMYPFVFIVIACGAISGFHGLVSSGTTAKQISRETDALFIGYGGMIGESLLGLAAVLACTAGFVSATAWSDHYASWNVAQGLGQSMAAFINGSSLFIAQLGVPEATARAFVALVAVSFALTTLDSGTRLLRYNIEEIAHTIGVPAIGNRYLSSALAVCFIGFFAFFRVDGQSAGLMLWALFGTTNQILGSLTLLTVTLYLMQRRSNYFYTLIPMVFMIVTTLVAMVYNIGIFYENGSLLLLGFGMILFVLAIWLIVEAIVRFLRIRAELANEGRPSMIS
ncbi:MAG: carbon starvation protein A [Acidobacteria bacterium]|nr:carbon starvation protein A [Acidobacteriota bacterium]